MSIFKRYVLFVWLKIFTVSFMMLIFLMIIATLTDGAIRESISYKEAFTNLFFQMPGWLLKILPLASLLATLFGINHLRSKNELVALFSLGFQRKDFVLLVAGIASFVVLFHFILSSFIDPLFLKMRHNWIVMSGANFKNHDIGGLRFGNIAGGNIWYKSRNYYLSFSGYDKHKKTLSDITIFYRTKKNISSSVIKSEKGKYTRNNIWSFSDGIEISDLNNYSYANISKFKTKSIYLNEIDSDFDQIDKKINTLDVVDLSRFIEQLDKNNINTYEYKVLFFDKFAQAILCAIFALLPIAGVFNVNRRNSAFGKNVFITVVFVVLYYLINSTVLTLGTNGKIPVIVATMFTPIILSAYILHTIYNQRRY